MNREDIQKLLGGYATDTLTPEEQQTLFEAALDDQELFDALAREQALRDLLRDPAARASLLAVLDDPPSRWYERFAVGWRPLAAAGVMAGVGALAVLMIRHNSPPRPVLLADVNRPQPPIAQMEMRDSGLAKESFAKPSAGQKAESESRRARPNQGREASSALARKEQDSISELPVPPKAELPVRQASPQIAGLREGSLPRPGAFGSVAPPVTQPVPPVPRSISGFRDGSQDEKGSMIGGIGGVPRTHPPSTASSPVSAPAMQAKTEGQASPQQAQSTAAQSQFGSAQPAQAPRFQQARLAQPLSQQTIEVQDSPARLDSASLQNAKSLFYGNPEESKDANSPAEDLQTVASTRKKAAQPTDSANTQGHATPNPGVRYSLRRKTRDGKFQQADPASLQAGDTLELEITPNDSGFLLVRRRGSDGGWRQVLSRPVERLKKYVVAPLKSGEKELLVSFRRQPSALTGAALTGGALVDKPRANLTQSTAEATYVVGDPTAQQVDFTITFIYK